MRHLPFLPPFSALLAVCAAGCNEYEVLTDLREQNIDQWITVEGARSDILFYADTSSSMDRELALIGREIERFTDRIEENSTDWQMIAVTGPEGCANTGILQPDSPNWQEFFAQGIEMPPGQDEVDEWGLFNVFQAVLETAPGGCNEGFVREGATLHVIFLADEDDNSPGYQLGGDYWRDYVDPILYLKDEPSQVRFSAIAGPLPNGCDGADPGIGYVDAAQYTGGEVLSVCDDWIEDVDLLADASVVATWFPLDYEPLPDTLIVRVNGEERTSGFAIELSEQGPGIRFTENPPGAWDELHFSYRAMVEIEVTETDAE